MRNEAIVLVVAFGYLALLFLIAAIGDRRAEQGRSLIGSSSVYALSIAVYCTAWTFYGSVGRATEAGPSFLLIYLGPTLAMLCGWMLIRKMVRIARAQRLTSIADFISARYGKSQSIGALVALIAVIGIIPYIALQLKAITVSYAILIDYPAQTSLQHAESLFFADKSFWIALVLAVFIILFGTRQLDASERHEGMVTAIAFESLIKLLAFLAVGIFVTFVLYQGPVDLFARAAEDPKLLHLLGLDNVPGGAAGWVGLLILSTLAFLTLPRQFQVMVVENVDERHIKRASWLFPLYLLAINIFVIPVALAGLMLGEAAQTPDSFVLTLPLAAGLEFLPLLVFIGGLSAATGMVIVETIALSTMISNQLVMPLLLRWRHLHLDHLYDLSGWLLGIRRVAILFILFLGYLYHALIGDSYSLVTIGLVSFAAAAQFAPALLIGLYWRGATRIAAAAGLMGGILVWGHTLLIPGFAQSGWLEMSLITAGPFGIEALRPYQLFGLQGLDIYSHSLFWSMLVNIGLILLVSQFTQPSRLEQTQAVLFTDALQNEHLHTPVWQGHTSRGELRQLVHRYLGAQATERLFAPFQCEGDLCDDQDPAPSEMIHQAEKQLAGALGSASARVLINSVVRGEALDLQAVLSILDTTSQTLEYNRRLEQKSEELTRIGQELKEANDRLRELDRLKDEFVAMVSHELRTPLTSIRAFAEILRDTPDLPATKRQHFLEVIVRESERLSRLIEEILDLARLESGRMTLNLQKLNLVEVVQQTRDAVARLYEDGGVTLTFTHQAQDPWVSADPDRLHQVLINLLENARKFAKTGAGEVSVSLSQVGRHLRLEVEDNGEGIPESEREKVFEKFHQVEQGNQARPKGRPRGTGLGLPICRGIVAHHGGRLWIDEPADLGGANVILELPRIPPPAQAQDLDAVTTEPSP
ncbi:sensor histidine kinase [Nitrincola tapanii]|uniref:histidine kinase n=1 Tax=Nitrincola tapanii TaxID=1708751 RepID=A0A5A9W3R9_9GAMM|nr:sensor histidine kinase [Nitrincola tapanii]KAA0875144.1 histidine kinase [Nitrincola tapanii]